MLKQLFSSFSLGIENLRTNFLHTLLSILGIVIGVASLVAILSLIDGMEKYAREQISTTTSLKNITIRTITNKTINNLTVRKDSFEILSLDDLSNLQQKLLIKGTAYLLSQKTNLLKLPDDDKPIAAVTIGIAPHLPSSQQIFPGHGFNEIEIKAKTKVAVINESLARLISNDTFYTRCIARSVILDQDEFKIIGILRNSPLPNPSILIPFSCLHEAQFSQTPPTCNIEVEKIEDVTQIKNEIQTWINNRFKDHASDFECITNEFRVEQVRKGFLLFRIVMGLIVGISVVVGGIGIMNVLLISITERTAEIGIRKALGANRRDIMRLFLSESITLSMLGSIIGIALGVLVTLLAIPVIKSFTKAPFEAAFTLNTILIIAAVSILIGIIFGTYPANKAARLDPVVAIQRT
jgi:putative ABC transport system permease protein